MPIKMRFHNGLGKLISLLAIGSCLFTSVTSSNNAVATRYLNAARGNSNNIVDLRGEEDFESLVAAQRDYSFTLLLTAVDSPPIQCGPCKVFQPVYEQIGRSLRKVSKKELQDQHVFTYLEFKNGREVFQKLKLQYAPVLLFFPPTSGPHATSSREPEQYDFNRLGFEGEDVAKYVSQRIGFVIPYKKPFPWQLVGTVAAGSISVVLLLLIILPRITSMIGASTSSDGSSVGQNPFKLIAGFLTKAFILAFITVMCAGHMWNGIRGAPFITTDGSGKVQYFAGGFQNQNAAETQIIAVIYGILAFSIVSLTVLVPTQKDPVKQRAGVYVWSAILISAVSLLLYVFRLKNASYPFRFLF